MTEDTGADQSDQLGRTYEGDALHQRMAELTRQVDEDRAQAAQAAKAAKSAQATRSAEQPPPKRRKRRILHKSATLIVVLAVLFGLYTYYTGRHVQPVASAPRIDPSLTAMPSAAAPRATATPTGSCYAGEPGCGSPEQPYAGSPSLTWADGADGIVLPAATQTGGFSSAQVSAALALAKQFLVDQTLVPDVLVGGAPPTAMIGLINGSNTPAVTIPQRIAAPTGVQDPSWLFVRFDPKDSALLTTPKVSGTITYSQVKTGDLQVDLSYKIVYALQKPDKSTWTRSMAEVTDQLSFFNGSGGFRATAGTVWPALMGVADYVGTSCGGPQDGFQEPWYVMDEGDNGPDPDSTVIDPYASATAGVQPTATSTAETCSAASRL